MLPELDKIKGIHPGTLLRWELHNRSIKSSELAKSIGEHKQTISAILNKRRDINPKLSIKLSKQFNTSTDYFMLLQASYDVQQVTSKAKNTPNIKKLRKVLFWDTSFENIDWNKNRRAVILRVFERGNRLEQKEIISFYGREIIAKELKVLKSQISSFSKKKFEEHNFIILE